MVQEEQDSKFQIPDSRTFDTGGRKTLSREELFRLGVFTLLTIAGTLVNPATYRIYGYVLAVLKDPGSQLFVSEWQTPDITSLVGILCFYGPFLLVTLLLLYSPRRLDLTQLGLFIGFSAFALTALRNGIWFCLIVSPLAAVHLGLLFPSKKEGKDSTGSIRMNQLLAALTLLAVILLSPVVYPLVSDSTHWSEATPVGVMDFIEEKGFEERIFHPQIYGDYLIWRLWPQQQSFVDGRVHLFGESFSRNYLAVFLDSCWEKRLEEFGIGLILLSKAEDRSVKLGKRVRSTGKWDLAYSDAQAELFLKRLASSN
jgi:hypothetical protein